MPPEEVEPLALHVEQCDRCTQALNGMKAEDTLIEAMSARSTTTDEDADKVGALIERLKALPAPAMEQTLTTVLDDTPSSERGPNPRLVAELRRHWRAGESIQVESFLAQHPDVQADRESVLDLIFNEILLREERGEKPALEEYVRRFPALKSELAAQFEVDEGLNGGDTLVPLAPPQGPGEIGRLAHYRVLRLLGSGGMGVVFQAEDIQLQRLVALKVMKSAVAKNRTARERFVREARAAARLKSDHVVTIHQVGEDRDMVFLAMEFLEGTSLEDWLKQTPRLRVGQAANIGRQIALGLAAAHERGLIHRDIKPGNIWLEKSDDRGTMNDEQKTVDSSFIVHHSSFPRVKLLDFGLAHATDDDKHLTQSGTILGTPAYMAPEQARSEKIDARADLFSLGVVLYRLCTGRLPFRGDNTMSILTSLAVDRPAPPREINPEIPPELATLIERLLAKDRTQRPASARAVADELAAIERAHIEAAKPPAAASSVDEATIAAASKAAPAPPAEPQPLPAPAPAPLRRRRLIAAAVFLAVLGAAALFFGGTVIRVVTNKGELIVQVDDDRVEVVVKQNGVEVRDKTKERVFVLTAGKGEVEFFDPETGVKMTTRRFSLSRGGRNRVSVRMAELAVKPALPTADRKAAEWVLSVGGRVQVNGEDGFFTAQTGLPQRDLFRLTRVDLDNNQLVSDAGLANFEGCKDIVILHLGATPLTDAGLTHFRKCKKLTNLSLGGTTAVTDKGLANFKDCKNLINLWLQQTKLTDEGLAYFRVCKNLSILSLTGTKVTDAGVGYFKNFKNLKQFDVARTKVTFAYFQDLKKALPQCNFQIDGGVLEPSADRKAAEWVLSLGGMVQIRQGGQARYVQTAKELPAAMFELIIVNLSRTKADDGGLKNLEKLTKLGRLDLISTPVTDLGLEHLKGLTSLGILDLQGTRVSDAGLAHLKGLTNLGQLNLHATQVSDSGLEYLKGLTNLFELGLSQTQVGDAGLAHLKGLTNLTGINLHSTRVSDAGLAHLRELSKLRGLVLNDTRVTDAGLAHLKGLTKLEDLGIHSTKVTDAGLAHLKALPKLGLLYLQRTAVSDAGLKELAALKKLESLNLVGTKVTATGVHALQAALPNCKIVSDFPQSLPDKEKPFVLVRADGKNRVEFRTLEEALFVLQNGDTIEVHGSGPFGVSARLNGKALNLKAAAGYRPKLRVENQIQVNGGLLIEGCDINCPAVEDPFRGGGGPWHFRNCRIWSPPLHGGLIRHTGPRLTFEDCLLATSHYTLVNLDSSTAAEVRLVNCIVPVGTPECVHVYGGGGTKVNLRSNYLSGGVFFGVICPHDSLDQPLNIEAEGNIFGVRPGCGDKKYCNWKGKDNLYVGNSLAWVVAGNKELRGLAGWRKHWGQNEQGGREADKVLFQWQDAELKGFATVLEGLQKQTQSLRKQYGDKLKDFGPKWELCGPGEAYVRALADQGKPVPKEKLRPPAPEGGPFVLLKQEKVVRGFPSLVEALKARADGDTIEIRKDGLLSAPANCPNKDANKPVGLRAAPGYRPILPGFFSESPDVISAEGIHFSGNAQFQFTRLANCLVDGRLINPRPKFDEPVEITNCLCRTVDFHLHKADARMVKVRNSVAEVIHFLDGSNRLELERSIVANRFSEKLIWSHAGQVHVRAQGSFFAPGLLPLMHDRMHSWTKGSNNVYETPEWNLLEVLRAGGKSPETGSLVIEPAMADPKQWRLLPQSPGYRAGPGGKDFGPDVSRIAIYVDADRRVAQWAMSIEGQIRIRESGQERDIHTLKNLPAGQFQVVGINVQGVKQVTDAGLLHLEGLTNLRYLNMEATPVSDDGLEHLQGLANLAELRLQFTRVTDDGLAHLKGLKNLISLNLHGAGVNGAGVVHLKGLPKFAHLVLSHTGANDAGMEHLKGLSNLTALDLSVTQVTDAGLKHLAGLTNLVSLDLARTRVSDAGMVHLKGLTNLRGLHLGGTQEFGGTQVSDAGLKELAALKKLESLNLVATKVTAAGVAALQKALPKCRIVSDFTADRKAAAWALSVGGSITIRSDGKDKGVREAKELPAGRWDVVGVHLHCQNTGEKVTDAGLEHLGGLTKLTGLDLYGTQVTGPGLEYLKGLSNLSSLGLGSTRIGDAALEHLKGLSNLTVLDLGGTQVTDAGMEHLKGLSNLSGLYLNFTRVSDAGLEQLKGLTKLSYIGLAHTAVTGPGIAHLKGLTNLSELHLAETRISEAGMKQVGTLTALTKLELHLSEVSDAGLAHLKSLPNLTELQLARTQVSDAGLQHLKGLTKVRVLNLANTKVTDEGLKALHGLTSLRELDLRTLTKVTATGVAALQKALPKCKVVWDNK
jgi:serine/threonine protein kinase/Leucine-rich repeat (LRR) protein